MTRHFSRGSAGFLLWFAWGLLALSLLVQGCEAAERFGRVRWVIDGDTVVLFSGEKIRYKGINTPEIAHEGSPAEPFGYEAKEFNQRLVAGKRVRILTKGRSSDQYGRTLAYLYLPDGRMVNEILLQKGLAYVTVKGPNAPFARRFVDLQRRAMKNGVGLWTLSSRMRKGRVIGNAKSLRFHRPSCHFGRRIWSGNRRYFRSVWDAFWDGYSPCKKCRPWP